MADAKPKFSKLSNDNYANWKFRMELLLRKQGLWKRVIEGCCPPAKVDRGVVINQTEIDDWESQDDEARGTIGLLVMDGDKTFCFIHPII